jgi:hypothetical protein
MNRLAQEAVIAGLARRLKERGSWSGETHVQKVTYILNDVARVPLSFHFILYKHGPFSFELRDELVSMRADGLLERQAQPAPYGPRIVVTERGRKLEERLRESVAQYASKLDWISGELAGKNVGELERLATALWVTRTNPEATSESRAQMLTEIKPHVSREDALNSVHEMDELLEEAQSLE